MTKNIILGAVAALVLGPTAALAADLAVKAPPPVAIYDWTGFYIGAAGGGSLGTSDHIDVATGRSDASGYNIKGGLAGGTLGYNWQMSSFVFGVEADASWVGEYGSNPDIGLAGILDGAGNPLFTSSTRETWMATVRARSGYAVNNLLFYVQAAMRLQALKPASRMPTPAFSSIPSTSTRSGWTAGGGLEWGFAPNWSAKFEMLYMKFNSVTFNTVQAEGPRTVPLDDTVARFGINYRFGGPVVARY